MKLPLLFLTALLLARPLGAAAASPTDDQLKRIDFEQKVGASISPDLPFIDEQGRPVKLGDYFGKPTILVLGYYRCPMLCSLVLNGMVSSLQDLKPSVGGLFDVIFVSIDPNETPALAAAKKANYVRLYARPGSQSGWHFLTGSKNSIDTLARESGYHFLYDPGSKEFAHPSGFTVLTADGKITRYFFGVTYNSGDIDKALRDGQSNRVGEVVHQFVFLCFHYNPIRGKYGAAIMMTMRIGAAATVLGLVGFIAINRGTR